MRASGPVWSVRNRCNKGFGGSNDPATDRYLTALQAVGVSRSIVALVMMANDREDLAGELNVLEQSNAPERVAFDFLVFVHGEFILLAQDVPAHTCLPDIAQKTRDRNFLACFGREAHLLGNCVDQVGHLFREPRKIAVVSLL